MIAVAHINDMLLLLHSAQINVTFALFEPCRLFVWSTLGMSSNRLCLNPDKTQFIWKRDVQHLAKMHTPSHTVTNLGLCVDSELTFYDYASKLCQQSFFHLRRLWMVRDSLTPYSLRTLVNSFVSNRLDYCNSVRFGASSLVLSRLQFVQNAAAHLNLEIPKYDHISSAIRNELHWQPIMRSTDYKLCLFVRKTAWLAPLRNT